jgi:retron-type reverse transcriptase
MLLDARQFLPISDKELKDKAKQINLWGNPWFGMRDRIPPASDPRTQLIDRAMVTRGYLTAEELVEMHRVGDLMMQIKGDEQWAAQRAREEVEEEREARKERKKRESAERRARRRAEVEKRRQTDIVFLGRGVSRGLADRRSNIEKLQKLGLPVLSSPSDVAQAMGVTIPQLRWLAYHSDAAQTTHYVSFQIPKRSGGARNISAPRKHIRRAQEWILREILQKIPTEPPAHGFVAGRSILTNAGEHLRRKVVINLDLKDFFPSITFPRVLGALESLGYSPAAATILALICTEAPRKKAVYDGTIYHVAVGPRGLPQGACTSPALSNLVARRLDRRVSGMAKKHGLSYTRYADDLTLSLDSKEAIAMTLARARHIVEEEGFEINWPKARVLRTGVEQTVTGVVVNDKINVPRRIRRLLRAILHNAKKSGLASQNRGGHPQFAAHLRGRVEFVRMVNPAAASKLKQALQQVTS